MAKRRRLSPANPVFLADDNPAPARPSAAGSGAAPIADISGQASAHAALAEVTETLVRAREEGRMILRLPLAQIDTGYLVRDRLQSDGEDMQALIESLRQRGQQTPIEVAPLGQERYGLISGWRRCAALAHLYAETSDPRFDGVLALVRQPDQSSDAYLAMVEENEIRVGLSFYERARIVARTVENSVYQSHSEALKALFASASKAKRSKIKSFVGLVTRLDDSLRYPQAIGERLGLQMARDLEQNPALVDRLKSSLAKAQPATSESEQAVIVSVLKQGSPATEGEVHSVEAREILPGLTIKAGRNSLTLKGAVLNQDVQKQLEDWLKQHLG